MAYETKELSGSLFESDKQHYKQPDYTGRCKIDGKEYRMAAWKTESRGGQKYLSVKFSDPTEYRRQKESEQQGQTSAPAGRRAMSDEEFQKERERRLKTSSQRNDDFADDDFADDDIPF